MKKQKKTIQQEINQFMKEWDYKSLTDFFKDVFPIIHLYNVDESNDWVNNIVGDDDTRNVRIIRTVYLLSVFAEKHAAKLCRTNVQFGKIWKRIEEEANQINQPTLVAEILP